MDQQKIGEFIQILRREKKLTQEQLAAQFGVSSRTVSRWETGRNLPDISLLVEIADFFDVDVRELIDGGRKSEMMDKETREVAVKMADYAGKEKSRLLSAVQIMSFIGVLAALITIGLQIYLRSADVRPTVLENLSTMMSVTALIVMAVITLYVTGLLEKMVKTTGFHKAVEIITIAVLSLAILRWVILWGSIGLVVLDSFFEKPEVYTDISSYTQQMSFGADSKWTKWGMDESIWPREITESMEVEDYKMVYYNPWDAQYLGYLVVKYEPDEYAKETERLRNYESTEYIGYYCVEEEHTYELLAVYADPYQGFVYALTDGESRIIYAEQIFCNYMMDLDYREYIPGEYLLDGFNATKDSPYYREMTKGL
ncbi:MAG: helix-turn-helix transcriptional regulator [Oscillospiraceae bacterium]|nr:helix-turn-helix transcriptional regulator [Oscillospiraceae bacterium]